MELTKATRTKQKMRLALQGGAGTGKTYGALLLAYGLTGRWESIAVIDTESNSASLYSHMGAFNTVQLSAPFTPTKYIEAITLCEQAGIEVIIIDSASPEWNGEGGVMDVYCSTEGDSYKKWDAIMPYHHAFIDAIIKSSVHIIATVRTSKAKVHMDDGYAHFFSTVLDLDNTYNAVVIKDRTQQLWGKLPTMLTPSVGNDLLKWCNAITKTVSPELQQRINRCHSLGELYALLFQEDVDNTEVMEAFTKRRLEIDGIIEPEQSSAGTSANHLSVV